MWQLLLILIIIIVFLLTRRNGKLMQLYNKMPCDSTLLLPIVGHAYKYLGSGESVMKSIEMHAKETTSKGGLMGLWHANILYIMVTDADASEYILKHCLEKDDMLNITRVFIGNGSIYAPVSIWRHRRKMIVPSFKSKNLNSFVEVFSRQSRILTDELQSFAGKEAVCLLECVTTSALSSIWETTMGVRLDGQKQFQKDVFNALNSLCEIALIRMSNPLLHNDFLFSKTPIYTRCMKYKATICDFIDKQIQEYRNNHNVQCVDYQSGPFRNFFDIMIEESQDNQGCTDLELQEEMLVLTVAGTDTSSVGITFTLLMLANYPDVQEKVYQELHEVFGNSDRPLVADDLLHLKYLEAVIKETLRLYPPGPVISRKVEHDITLPSGVKLLKGCGILINIWGLHRNSKYWGPDAEEFRPERFLSPLTHSGAYIPFSSGPRNCIGRQYAHMAMKTVVSDLLRRYRILPAPDPVTGKITTKTPLKIKYNLFLRHVENCRVILENRLMSKSNMNVNKND